MSWWGTDDDAEKRRRLSSDCDKKQGWGITTMWIVIVLYMFLGIAIVCDELFVPALEIIAEKAELSDDVSGATLMAAGGSAPELATSLIGTFSRSEVGFGTIVGSAVFNVLFVIAMCALFTPTHLAPLKLTWWPLARDCSYYVVTLAALGVWFAVSSPTVITAWEAAVQFVLYVGYVVMMSQNERIEGWVKSKLPRKKSAAQDEGDVEDHVPPERMSSAVSSTSSKKRPTAFRAGIGRLILGKNMTVAQITGMGVVAQISGDVDATFAQIDTEERGYLDVRDLRRLLVNLGNEEPKDEDIEALKKHLDSNSDGRIDPGEFKVWYIQSEARLKTEVRRIFEMFDVNGDGAVEYKEIESVLQVLETISKDQAKQALSTFPKQEQVTFEQFQAWYEQTVFWAKHKTEAASSTSSFRSQIMDTLRSTCACGGGGGAKSDEMRRSSVDSAASTVIAEEEELSIPGRIFFILALPLNLALGFTVPDCRVPDRQYLCYLSFLMSIVWIGAFSYAMVTGIEVIGVQIGVPEFIMGLVFLAAGTSVPDLLSSVVVAKQGKGDMAVSSSIGSNIFDVTVGLPVPWLLFTAIQWENVQVRGSVAISISILLGMVILVIAAIASLGWQMNLKLGAFMLLLYLIYLIQEILRTDFSKC